MTTWASPTVTTPPTATPVAPSATPTGPRRLNAIALTVLAFVLGNLAAILVGGIVGGIAIGAAATECSPGETWCGLGAAFIGIALAMLAGAIGYVAAGVLLIRRCRPAGERFGSVIIHLALPWVLVMLPGLGGVVL